MDGSFHEPLLARWTQRDQSPRFDGQCRWLSIPSFRSWPLPGTFPPDWHSEPTTPPGRQYPAVRGGIGHGCFSFLEQRCLCVSGCSKASLPKNRPRLADTIRMHPSCNRDGVMRWECSLGGPNLPRFFRPGPFPALPVALGGDPRTRYTGGRERYLLGSVHRVAGPARP